jgi:DNA repair protein RadD
MLQLRPYQEAALAGLDAYFARARGNPVIVAPTGSGKSLMIAEFCRRVFASWPTTVILMLTHVRELVQQNADELRTLWPEAPVGIYSAGLGLRQVRPITFGGIQSLYDQAEKLGHVDLVLVDEAHLVPHSGEGMYRTLLGDLQKTNPKLKVIGFTATPFRTDSGRLTDPGGIFTDIAYDIDLLQLIRQGFLCNLVSQAVGDEAVINTDSVPIRAGEFAAGELEKAALDVVSQSLHELTRLGARRRFWLVFAAGVDHGFDIACRLNEEHHIEARMVAGDTPKDQRDEMVAAFKAGELRCLVNANVLTTGFNAPGTDLIALLRATCSPGLLVQMCGRGMRTAEGKRDCLVLDFGGNFERHGPINAVRPRVRRADGSLSRSEPVVPRLCFACGHQEVVRSAKCENCDTPWPKPVATHDTTPGTAPVIVEPEDLVVMGMVYGRHTSRKQDKPDSMIVSYHTANGWVDEWICLEHTGYARQKAAQWWGRRGKVPIPETVADALERADELRMPEKIRVGMEGNFWRVLGHHWYLDAEKEQQVRAERIARRMKLAAEEKAKQQYLPGNYDDIPF